MLGKTSRKPNRQWHEHSPHLAAHIHFLAISIVLTRVYYELPLRNKKLSLWHESGKVRVITIDKMRVNMGDGVSYKPSKKDKSCADKPPAWAVPFDFGAALKGGRRVVGT